MTAIERLEIKAPQVIATCSVFLLLNITIVALRIVARRTNGEAVAHDDYTSIAAAVFVVASTVTFIIEAAKKGLGYAETVGHPDNSGADANISYWPTEVLSIPAIGLIKLTFLLLYRRIFSKGGAHRLYWVNTVYIWVTASWTLCFSLLFIFFCGVHPQSYWISDFTEATQCVQTHPAHLSFVISDFIMDLITMVLPWPRLMILQMPFKKKLGLFAVFLVGALTVAMSGLRMIMFIRLLAVQFDPDLDFEYVSTSASYWTQLEMSIGLIAACLPVMYGLIRRYSVKGIFRKTTYSGRYANESRTKATLRSSRHMTYELPYDGIRGQRLPSEDGDDGRRTRLPTGNGSGPKQGGSDIEMHSVPFSVSRNEP